MLLRIVTATFFILLFSGCEKRQSYEPTGEKVEIKTYKVGIHPYLNSKKMFDSYEPILRYLEKRLGDVELKLETSATYAKYNEKLYAGEFALSLPNPFQTYNALQKGYRVIAKMKPDSVFRGIIVARKDARLKKPEQLIGQKVSFPAPTALAATMMPLLYLQEHGVDVHTQLTKRFVGSQYSSILNAFTKDTVAGATWPPPWESWRKENPEKARQMEVVWETKPLINNGFIVKKEFDAKLAAKLQQLLVQLDRTSEGKRLLENAGFAGFEVATDADYDVVKTFLTRYEQVVGEKR